MLLWQGLNTALMCSKEAQKSMSWLPNNFALTVFVVENYTYSRSTLLWQSVSFCQTHFWTEALLALKNWTFIYLYLFAYHIYSGHIDASENYSLDWTCVTDKNSMSCVSSIIILMDIPTIRISSVICLVPKESNPICNVDYPAHPHFLKSHPIWQLGQRLCKYPFSFISGCARGDIV